MYKGPWKPLDTSIPWWKKQLWETEGSKKRKVWYIAGKRCFKQRYENVSWGKGSNRGGKAEAKRDVELNNERSKERYNGEEAGEKKQKRTEENSQAEDCSPVLYYKTYLYSISKLSNK